jgi:3-methyladenine DNA glycosylase Mpg
MTTPTPAIPPFDANFYAQSALTVARTLLGARLVRRLPDGTRIVGRIVETEAYSGIEDLASHARGKRTPRNLPMWGKDALDAEHRHRAGRYARRCADPRD